MIKLIKRPPNLDYRQEMQLKNVLFSVATVDWEAETATEWFAAVKCRDYLGDIQYSRQFETPASIYGFNFDYTKVKDDPDYLNLVVHFGVNEKNTFWENLSILRDIELQNNLNPTDIFDTDDPNAFLFRADKFWKSDTHLISLYSWLPRLLSYKIENKNYFVASLIELPRTIELERLKSIRTNFNIFIKDMKNYKLKSEEEWLAKHKIPLLDTWHNNTGIVNYLLKEKK